MTIKPRAMVISVGGTPTPIVFSLNKLRPEYICFFVSKETKKSINEVILPVLNFKFVHHDWIVTPNAELLSECYAQLTKRLPEILEKWEVEPDEVCVDYTCGTKTMSVALSLATIEKSCCYSYIGGNERSKGGVGVVVDGNERMWFLDNPWDEIALKERKEISILFNKARYASATEILQKCVERVSRQQKPHFKALHEMTMGYDLWDRFKHKEAKVRLHKSHDTLFAFWQASEKSEIKILTRSLDQNIEFLERLIQGARPSAYYFYDLLANAKRRADLEQKFDDAAARLYRAMEVLAQAELKTKFGIEASSVKPDEIPERIREEYLKKYSDKNDSKVKIPLYAGFYLLKELGNSLADHFFQLYDGQMRSLLDVRNQSILAHGFNPITRETFERLFDLIMRFSETSDELLPRFPVLTL